MSDPSLLLAFTEGTLTLEGPVPQPLRTAFQGRDWVWDRRASVWRCDAIHYAREAAWLESMGLDLLDDVPRWRPVDWPRVDLPKLRQEQRAAVRAWRRTRRGAIVMPTGTGKTEVALSIMAKMRCTTLVVAPVRDLMYQWHRRIAERLGLDAGVVGDSQYRIGPVCCTTYDSACIHMEHFGNRFQLVVFDECHHLPGAVRRGCPLLRCGLDSPRRRTRPRTAGAIWRR